MKKIAIFCFVSMFLSCIQSQSTISPTALLIRDVNIVDVENGVILEQRQVVIDSGRIKLISTDLDQIDDYTRQIDGSNQFLLPGLAEMHAHIPSPPTSAERVEETLFLYLSNGITTIRGMLGHPSHLVLRDRALAGDLLSPRIYTSSPSLNGNSVQTPEEAEEKVLLYASAGYDFLKIHPGIRLEVFEVLVETAKQKGISYSGHVPVDVGIVRALESGYGTIDHVDGFLEGLVPEDRITDPNTNGFFGFNFTAQADTSRIKELVELSRERNVWVVPTQSLFERWFAPTTADEMLSQAEMKYMPRSTLENWRERKIRATGPQSDFDQKTWVRFIEIRRRLIRELQEHGKGLLLGSDAPQIFNVPGFSIQREIQAMLKAGLTPLQILQSGTINVAEFFGMTDRFGQIKEGLAADAILVKNNPLEDLSALREISGVMIRGRWLPKKEIDRRLQEIALHSKE